MRLAPGDRLGQYEILSFVGAGGMGEVYKARHTRLDRTAALKVLPAGVASDPARLERLEREARILSRVDDPNIVSVYDIATEGSTTYIAMEFVDGHSLSQLLERGPLGLARLLDVGCQIASGLASSHEVGVVHRDVKPANVVVSKSGVVKILDFGLATRREMTVLSSEETTVSALTDGRKIGGTLQYMSPEQASDGAVDFRTDQFSLGVVLVEAATGRSTVRHSAGVSPLWEAVEWQVDVTSPLDAGIPLPLRWLIARCLAKDPGRRFASTRDLARDLADVRDHVTQLTQGNRNEAAQLRSLRLQRAALATGLCAALSAALAIGLAQQQPPASGFRFTIEPPPGTVFNFASSAPAPAALSADGRRIVFGARDGSGATRLWVRSLETMNQQSLAGTEGAAYPFWSADGTAIGFFADGKLQRVPAAGGPVQTLAAAPEGRGGTWNGAGVVLFAPDSDGPIQRIGPGAAPLTPVTTTRPGVSHRWPRFLPDGKHFLYLERIAGAEGQKRDLYVGSLNGATPRLLLSDASDAVVAPGHLLFVRDGVLLAIAFDAHALRVSGAPIAVADGVYYHRYRLNGLFSAAANGVIAFQTGYESRVSRLVWHDRTGRELGSLGEPDDYGGLRLSPDGTRCAVEVRNAKTGSIDLWVVDIANGLRRRITSGGPMSDAPVWSPDGRKILFSSNRGGRWDLYTTDASGLGAPQLALASERDAIPSDWSPDGTQLVFSRAGGEGGGKWDVWLAQLSGGEARPLVDTPFDEGESRFSPDGTMLAYSSEASGQREIYVRALRSPARDWRVSPRGGSQPIWRSDGRELFYVDASGFLMAMAVAPRGFDVSQPRPIFESSLITSASDIPLYDVASDGGRFLMNVRLGGRAASPITIITGWTGPAQ